MLEQQPPVFRLTVQFEDVDANGVVHHPNYLKYLERARSYSIKKGGYSVERILSSYSALVVTEIHAKYLRPALLDQELFVISRVDAVGKSLIKICQFITPNLPTDEEIETVEEKLSLPEMILWAQISLVYVDLKSAKPKSIPQELKQAIKMNN